MSSMKGRLVRLFLTPLRLHRWKNQEKMTKFDDYGIDQRWLAMLRPFLMQSDLSVEDDLFRLEPKSGFLTQSKKGFFDSTFFD